MWIVPSDQYLFLPDTAHPVAPLVRVKGGKDPTGPGQHLLRRGHRPPGQALREVLPVVHDGATLVPASVINPPGESDSQRRAQDLREMAQSQNVAPAVALKYLGYNVKVGYTGRAGGGDRRRRPRREGRDPADRGDRLGRREAGAPDDRPAEPDVRPQARRHRSPGRARREGHPRGGREDGRRSTQPETGGDRRPRRPGEPGDAAVPGHRSTRGSIGGPSAGLAFALDVLEELGHDVDRGYKVAATGEIDLDGSVGPIGGVKQKTIGVRRAGVDVFLVPAGDNAKEARKYAGSVEDHPCGEFSTGVARAGNTSAEVVKNRCKSADFESSAKSRVFAAAPPCAMAGAP